MGRKWLNRPSPVEAAHRALGFHQQPCLHSLFVALTVANLKIQSDNMLMRSVFLVLAAVPLLACCSVAKTAVDVAMVPVHVATAGVNAIVPSQKKADEKRGRALRKEDEERGKQIRLAQERCQKGKALPGDDCTTAVQR